MAASEQDVQALCLVLSGTFEAHAGVRAQAEQRLEQMEATPGGHALMLQVITRNDVAVHVRQAAALRLKNIYQSASSVREGKLCKVSPIDRKFMYDHLLEAIIQQPHPLLRVQLLLVVYYLWPTEAPADWASLVPAVVANVQAGMTSSPPNLMRVYGSVCVLRMVFKRYQYKAAESRKVLDEIVAATFPLLLAVLRAQLALPNLTEENRELCRILIKIFFLASTLTIPPLLLNDFAGAAAPWFDAQLFLLEANLPGLESTGGDAEKLRVTAGWKTKKWIAGAFLRIYNRYGRPAYVGNTDSSKVTKQEKAAKKAWATAFESQYSTRVLAAFMNMLKAKTQGQYVSERVVHTAFSYISVCTGGSFHFKMLKPALPFLIQEAILQQLQLTPADLDLWKNDPQEWIRRNLDLMEEFLDPRLAATGLLFELVQMRTTTTLPLTLSTITQVFEAYESAPAPQKNPIQKEAAMRMFGSLKRLLLSKKEFYAPIENLLVRHILPEFASPHGFLRQRACWVVRKYNKLKWSAAGEVSHVAAVRCCVERLEDPELPVKLEAWESVSYVIEHDKVFEFLRPSLPLIIEQFFKLYEEIGNERVVGVLSTLVERFGDDVAPYGVRLVAQLSQMFMKLITTALGDGVTPLNENSFDAEDDEASEGALQCLRTINSVMYACESRLEMFAQFLPHCLPVMQRGIREDCIEHYDDVLDMVSIFTYFPEQIPDAMWQFLPRILTSFLGPEAWAGDFLQNMLSPLDNYLVKGGDALVTPQGLPMLEGIVSIVKAVLGDQERLIDSSQACVLVESLLANLRGKIDPVLPTLLELTSTRLLTIIDMEEAREAARKRKAAAAAKAGGLKKGKKAGARKGRRTDAIKTAEEEEDDNEGDELMQLKFHLLDNIGVGVHYNPLLFVQWVCAQPEEVGKRLFNVWLSYLERMQDDFDAAKNAVLGLSSLLLLPLQALPPRWANAVPTVLNKLVALLAAMSEVLEEDAKNGDEDGPEDDDGAVQFQDIHEDKDVYHPSDDDDDDASSVEADAAEEDGGDEDTGAFIDDMEEAMLGGDHSKFVSPLDDIDPFVFFMQCLEVLSRQENAFYNQWIASIGAEGGAALQKHADQAKKHAAEMAAEKEKDAAEKAAKLAQQQQRQQQFKQ